MKNYSFFRTLPWGTNVVRIYRGVRSYLCTFLMPLRLFPHRPSIMSVPRLHSPSIRSHCGFFRPVPLGKDSMVSHPCCGCCRRSEIAHCLPGATWLWKLDFFRSIFGSRIGRNPWTDNPCTLACPALAPRPLSPKCDRNMGAATENMDKNIFMGGPYNHHFQIQGL